MLQLGILASTKATDMQAVIDAIESKKLNQFFGNAQGWGKRKIIAVFETEGNVYEANYDFKVEGDN